ADCFFFRAEDGIRFLIVTGVQTCALPIFGVIEAESNSAPVVDSASITPTSPTTNQSVTANVTSHDADGDTVAYAYQWYLGVAPRSEERRVGKEYSYGWGRGREATRYWTNA